MLICIDAGHYRNTPGKRCLKSIDPNETREWVLNSRIAEQLQQRLSAYRCRTMRVDDPTGTENIGLSARVTAANEAKADVYLSIHHNAGIRGGSGGGIVMYTSQDPSEEERALQEAVYRNVVERTGLRGNRASPLGKANYYVLRKTDMPAVLGEFGFMDSQTDTPVILEPEYARRVADGIADGLVELYQLEEAELTQEQVRAIAREEYERIEAERAGRQASPWAQEGVEQARSRGITDGSRPQSYATRQEVMLMVNAAVQ